MDSNGALYGKRKKKLPRCANPLFSQWLTEWRDDLAAKGVKSHYNFNKALKSLQKYPLPLQSGKACKFLENFGDKICSMLDKKLEEYRAEYGTTDPITTADDRRNRLDVIISSSSDDDCPPQKQVYHNEVGDHWLAILEICNKSPSRNGEPRRKRVCSGRKEYIPQSRSGPYAIILTLYNYSKTAGSLGYMMKSEIIEEGQPLADKSFKFPDPGGRYTAWSSMGSLIKKGYVKKESSPARYSLTDTGEALAVAILEADKDNDVMYSSNFTELRTNTSPRLDIDLRARLGLATSLQPDLLSETASKFREDSSGSSNMYVSDIETRPAPEVDHINLHPDMETRDLNLPLTCSSNEVSSDGLKFWYVSDTNETVTYKDKAAVLIDEEISVGFLIKAKYEELLMSAKRYKIDVCRAGDGDYIYAYVHNDDIGERANPPISMVTTSKFSAAVSVSTEINRYKDTGGACAVGGASGAGAKVLQKKEPTKKITETFPRSSTSASVTEKKRNLPTTISPVIVVDDLSQNTERSWNSSTQDSQSQESVTSINMNGPPKFVLRPGTFQVLLCVDNCELAGASSSGSKEMFLRELHRNHIDFEMRKLQVGDFVWVARSRGSLQSGELVLPFVIERKRMDDLASSIVDGRFREQKFRLRNCGLNRPIFLVEDYGSAQHFSISEDTLHQAIANTQVIDQFAVKRTGDIRESAAYLTVMTRYLQALYKTKTLCAHTKDEVENSTKTRVEDQEEKLMTWQEFSDFSVKNKTLTVSEMFGKLLVQLKGMTTEKASAILQVYPTPALLMEAYDECSSEKEKDNLLVDIKFGVMKRKVGATLSKVVYLMFSRDRVSS